MKTKALGILLAATLGVGCNVCENLDQRICADLGDEQCALWRASGETFVDKATKSRGRRSFMRSLLFGDGASVCESAGKDPVYPKMVEAAKAMAELQRKTEKK